MTRAWRAKQPLGTLTALEHRLWHTICIEHFSRDPPWPQSVIVVGQESMEAEGLVILQDFWGANLEPLLPPPYVVQIRKILDSHPILVPDDDLAAG